MPSVPTIQSACFCYGDLRIPLIGGEFHYWRVPAENWPKILDRIEEMGLRVVSTYIPWSYHEVGVSDFDFSGRTSPQKNLTGFLDLLKARGFYAIVRPGPYIYAEWPHGGPPARAVAHDRMSEEFGVMARDWISAVAAEIVPRQVTKGGNIVLCQSDNEPYPSVESFGDEMGCFGGGGIFTEWLNERYQGDLNALNAAWSSEMSSFANACFHFHEICVDTTIPLAERLAPGQDLALRFSDSLAFIGWYSASIVRNVSCWLRECGVDIPICSNGWSPLYMDFGMLADVSDVVGIDVYPQAFMEGHEIGADNWHYNLDILKTAEAEVADGNVWSAEFQSGNYPARVVGSLPVGHFKFAASAMVARGLKGLNWYMLVGRDNWPGSPIDEWGSVNTYFTEHRETVQLLDAIRPWDLEYRADLELTLYKPHRVNSPGNFDAVCRCLEDVDVSYRYFNASSRNPPRTRVLLYAGDDWLEPDVMEQIGGFVHSGGTLICFSRAPFEKAFDGRAGLLGLNRPDGIRPTNLPVHISYRTGSMDLSQGGHCGRKVNFAYFHEAEGDPITVEIQSTAKDVLVDVGTAGARSFIAGFGKDCGEGRILFIGSNPSPQLLRMVLTAEGLKPAVSSRTSGVTSSILEGAGGRVVLAVINRLNHAGIFELELSAELPHDWRWISNGQTSGSSQEGSVTNGILLVRLPAKSVGFWEASFA